MGNPNMIGQYDEDIYMMKFNEKDNKEVKDERCIIYNAFYSDSR